MSTCPHMTHPKPKPVSWDTALISSCQDGCSRTLVFCASCEQEANHPLARYCRRCGEPQQFDKLEAMLEAAFRLDDRQPRHYQHSLTAYGINKVQSLSAFHGHLFVTSDNGLLIYDINDLSAPLNQFRIEGDDFIRGVAVPPASNDVPVFVTTSAAIYKLTLLNHRAAPQLIYRPAAGRSILHPTIRLGQQLLIFEYEQAANVTRFSRLGGDELTSVAGPVFYARAIEPDRVFFFTAGEVFLFDARSGTTLRWRAEEPLARVEPVFTEELGSVYVVGERRIWRLNVDSQSPLLLALNTKPFVDACISGRGAYLLVAHASGLFVLDAFGGVKWDSADDFIDAQSDGEPPQVYGDFFTFSAIGRAGGRILRIHQLNRPGDFRDRLVFERPLLCPPLLNLGKMIVATGGDGGVELHTYDLGSFQMKPYTAVFAP